MHVKREKVTYTGGNVCEILGDRVRTRVAGEGGSRWLGIEVEPCLPSTSRFLQGVLPVKILGQSKKILVLHVAQG